MKSANNIVSLIQESQRNFPDHQAVIYKNDMLSYQELWVNVCEFSRALCLQGIKSGDRIGIYLDKGIETVIAIFACVASGGVIVPINTQLKAPQVAHIINDCQANVLIVNSGRASLLGGGLSDCASLERVIIVDHDAGDKLPSISRARSVQWEQLLACNTDQGIDNSVNKSMGGSPAIGLDTVELSSIEQQISNITIDTDVAAIFYTSGSTGLPKGVVLSHRNILDGASSVSSYLENTTEDKLLGVLPLSFDAGFSQLTTAFASGASVVLVNYLMAKDIPLLCEKEGITGITAVPPLWHQLMQAAWPETASRTLRYLANTGGKLPRTTLSKMRQVFPQAKPFLMYGLTEAFRSTYLDPSEIDKRPDSIGKAIPNARVVVLREDATECDDNEPGELVHIGATVGLGYWNRPELNAQRYRTIPSPINPSIQVACVWSGDLVTRDEDGYLYFKGRKDDMIKTSGYRVSPNEIEDIILKSGLVAEVAAFAVDDEVLTHRIEIACTLGSAAQGESTVSEPEILRFCRNNLPRYMVPQTIHTMDELPLNNNGKYDRKKIMTLTRTEEVLA